MTKCGVVCGQQYSKALLLSRRGRPCKHRPEGSKGDSNVVTEEKYSQHLRVQKPWRAMYVSCFRGQCSWEEKNGRKEKKSRIWWGSGDAMGGGSHGIDHVGLINPSRTWVYAQREMVGKFWTGRSDIIRSVFKG